MSSDDPGILDIIGPLDISEDQAKLLNPYVMDGVIDTNLYLFELLRVATIAYMVNDQLNL